MKEKNISCYILCGGKSSRMGEDKATKKLLETSMLEIITEECKKVFEHVFLVSSNKIHEHFNLETVKDIYENIGPLGGIFSSLEHAKTKQVFIISCDMPFIKSEVIIDFIKNIYANNICVAEHNNEIEPLLGVYQKHLLNEIKKEIDASNLKLKTVLKLLNYKTINMQNWLSKYSNLFLNINTPDDFINAEKNLKL